MSWRPIVMTSSTVRSPITSRIAASDKSRNVWPGLRTSKRYCLGSSMRYCMTHSTSAAFRSPVTIDLNAALVEWVVQYRIDDPKQYLFDVRNPAQTLRDLSEAAMREVIGDRTVDEVITIGRQDIEVSALARMQELAKRYMLGVRVDQVQLKNVNPPAEVQASFNEVNKAQQDRENAINIANGDYNEAVPRAQGQADQAIRAAEGYRFKRVNEAQGDVASFNAMLAEYVKAPEITRTRLYLETMGDVLPATGEKIIIDDSMRNLLPILPLDPIPLEKR